MAKKNKRKQDLNKKIAKTPEAAAQQAREPGFDKASTEKQHAKNRQTAGTLGQNGWLLRSGLGIALLVFAIIIYLPSFKASFHLDDLSSIVKNQYVHMTDLAPSTLIRAARQDGLQNRPLSNLSFGLNYYFGQDNPLGYHIVNFVFSRAYNLKCAVWAPIFNRKKHICVAGLWILMGIL